MVDQLQAVGPSDVSLQPVISTLSPQASTPSRAITMPGSASARNTPKSAVDVSNGLTVITGMEREISDPESGGAGIMQPLHLPLTPLVGNSANNSFYNARPTVSPLRIDSSPPLECDVAEERASLEILHEKDVILSQCYQTIDQLQLVIQEKDAQIQELKQYPDMLAMKDEQLLEITTKTNALYADYMQEISKLKSMNEQRLMLFVVSHVNNNRKEMERLQLLYCFTQWKAEVRGDKLVALKAKVQELTLLANNQAVSTGLNVHSGVHNQQIRTEECNQDTINEINTIDADLVHYLPAAGGVSTNSKNTANAIASAHTNATTVNNNNNNVIHSGDMNAANTESNWDSNAVTKEGEGSGSGSGSAVEDILFAIVIKVIGWLLLLLITYYILDTNSGVSNGSYYNQWVQWCQSESGSCTLPSLEYGNITPHMNTILITTKQLFYTLIAREWSKCIPLMSSIYTPLILLLQYFHELLVLVVMNLLCIMYKYIQLHYRITS